MGSYRFKKDYGSMIESAIKTITEDGKGPETLHEITQKGTGTICALGRVLWREEQEAAGLKK